MNYNKELWIDVFTHVMSEKWEDGEKFCIKISPMDKLSFYGLVIEDITHIPAHLTMMSMSVMKFGDYDQIREDLLNTLLNIHGILENLPITKSCLNTAYIKVASVGIDPKYYIVALGYDI